MAKFDASKFVTAPEMTPQKQFKYEVEDILRHVKNLKPGLRVGWVRERPHVIVIAVDRNTVGCMTVISTAAWGERTPYGDIDVAVYDDMSLREVIASWEANDDRAAANAIYPGSIEAGCRQLDWIVEPDDDEEFWDGYI